jgi:hypothetical protein
MRAMPTFRIQFRVHAMHISRFEIRRNKMVCVLRLKQNASSNSYAKNDALLIIFLCMKYHQKWRI